MSEVLPPPLDGFTTPPAPVAAGLDLSLTDTGVAVVHTDGSIRTARVRSSGKKTDSLKVKARRFDDHAAAICAQVAPCTEVVVESPAYGMPQGAVDLGGLRWLVLTMLVDRGHHVHEINPMHVKKYATGETRADKDVVLAAVVKRYPQADVTNNNTADAVVLASMLARHVGHPVEGDLSQSRWDAFGKVAWSE
ncbi:hypothetical protein Csp2054_14165 [Curtobacterium sp. 'Ferrero']|uniref:crossover junction endodeoxyribonuclease RuvC n=1 Tax=Curtobacterium sp. 'Ferrero' TaxID=2033654 RepID=UPI000BC64C6E|nr:crossover junction endodeoxyribonuclease RuvC [Curtobacterium sp. 'Ferrero']PCN46984.1 hypothetical protein Csp2054_14165 [Curtobacterium sp. 'Ferrero']